MNQTTPVAAALPPRTGQERNYGIDFLRCVAMFMVVVLHIFNRGGAAEALRASTPAYQITFPLRILCAGAVNLFGLISGYVMFNSRFKLRRLLELWFQILITGLALCIVGVLVCPKDTTGQVWLRALMPISQREFWYFSAYVGALVLSPLVNRGLSSMNRTQTLAVLWGSVLTFSVASIWGYCVVGDPFGIKSGYSALWLLVLYIIGACIRKENLLSGVKSRWLWLALAASLAVSLGLDDLHRLAGWTALGSIQLANYVNPLQLVNGVCLLVLFSRLPCRSKGVRNVIRFFAPLSFGVYLIHVHNTCWVWLEGRFRFLTGLPLWQMLPALLGCALAIYLVCSGLDWLRCLAFRLCRISRLCGWLEDRLKTGFLKIIRARPGMGTK